MTHGLGIVVRAADRSDVDAVTAIYREAFAGSMGVALGPAYTRAFVDWFVSAGHICQVAEVGGALPVGFVVGAPVAAEADRQRALRPLVARALTSHPGLVADARIRTELLRQVRAQVEARRPGARRGRSGTSPDALPDADAGACSLVGIGARRSHRGLGVGDRLVEAFERAAVAAGHPRVRLSVYRDNAAALALYERHGWTPDDHPTNPAVVYCRKQLAG